VSALTCPVCGKPPEARYRPFCSSRCADVDLHRWLSGAHTIPGAAPDQADSTAAEEDDDR